LNKPLCVFLAFALIEIVSVSSARAESLTVFAAASLKNALDDVAGAFSSSTGTDVTLSYAGSSVLAWQIGHGAPADVFISASPDWMDRLQEDGRIVPESRVEILGNELVLIAHGDSSPQDIEPNLDLAGMLDGGRLAMALVDAVPAGFYGRNALQNLGLWAEMEPHVAQVDNVRAALALVATGEAPLGIVYATDALASTEVSVIGSFPPATHPSIVYPAAAVAGRESETIDAFLDYLQGEQAGEIFSRHGFVFLGQ